MHLNFHFSCRVVIHALGFDFPLIYGFQDAVDKRSCSLTEWDFTDNKCLVVELFNLCSHLQHTAPLSVIIFTDINSTACREVGIKLKIFSPQVFDSCITDFIQVMRQQFAAQSDSNTLGSLGKKQRKLHGKRDRFLVSSVITQLPIRGLWIENYVKSKLRKARLYIAWRRSSVSGKDVSPVSLAVNEQVFLSHLHQSISYRSITMGMKLHGMPHNISHFVVTSVVHTLHGVKNTALNRLQSVLNMRHSTL